MSVPIAERLRGWAAGVASPTGPPPRPTRRNWHFDIALAVVLAVAAVWYVLRGLDAGPVLVVDQDFPSANAAEVPRPGADDDSRVQAAMVAVVSSAALVFRRRFPLTVLWVVLAITGVIVSDEPRLTIYTLIIAAYSAAAYGPYRVPTLVTAALAAVTVTFAQDSALPIVPTQFVPLLVLVPAVVAADGMRRWRLLEQKRADAVRRATTAERERIARELHDVVTHNVSVMVIQAGAARTVLRTAPDQAEEALRSVEVGGRAAMTELRQAIGLLSTDADRSGPGDPDHLAPQPNLDRLQYLVQRVRDAGLTVELTVDGEVRPLPPGVELAAYRVVQEALTNTMRHAAGASAVVIVRYAKDGLRIEVTDTGGSPSPSGEGGTGRGLIGLRERLAVYGGTLTTGRRLTGGYRLEAVIPMETS